MLTTGVLLQQNTFVSHATCVTVTVAIATASIQCWEAVRGAQHARGEAKDGRRGCNEHVRLAIHGSDNWRHAPNGGAWCS